MGGWANDSAVENGGEGREGHRLVEDDETHGDLRVFPNNRMAQRGGAVLKSCLDALWVRIHAWNRIEEHGNSESLELWNSGIPKFRNSEIPKFQNSEIPKF